jgi:hypothetical protein
MGEADALSFDFYGLRVAVQADDGDLLEDVRRDFSYFRTEPGVAAMGVVLTAEPGPRTELPRLKATLQTPRNIVYRDADVSYIDYFGKALMTQGRRDGACVIYCRDRDLAHEIAFLTILSRVGEHLDAIGLHRVHALGLQAQGSAALVLLPMGGGKTTLTLQMLQTEGIRLLSEDSPLISRNGEVHPFPLRIGVQPGEEPPGTPPELARTVQRMEHGPKTLIDIEHYRDRIGERCPPGVILLGERWLAGPSAILPERRRRALDAFLRHCVVGLGLYQGVEFVFERTAWELIGKAGVALSRLRSSVSVIRRARVYRFAMGPDRRQSAQVLAEFLHGKALRRDD